MEQVQIGNLDVDFHGSSNSLILENFSDSVPEIWKLLLTKDPAMEKLPNAAFRLSNTLLINPGASYLHLGLI